MASQVLFEAVQNMTMKTVQFILESTGNININSSGNISMAGSTIAIGGEGAIFSAVKGDLYQALFTAFIIHYGTHQHSYVSPGGPAITTPDLETMDPTVITKFITDLTQTLSTTVKLK